MRVTLIITTYNRPDALELVLLSAFAQSRLPDEIVIGDDGSDASTAQLIQHMRDFSPVPLVHTWQDDQGFRAARVRNLAVSQSSGDYLVFTDGDMILHPAFIESHVNAARPGYYLTGKRTMITPWMTPGVIRRKQIRISPWSPGITLRRHAWHIPFLAEKYSRASESWYTILGANMSLWYDDFEAINGFNEDFEGWGREDSEFSYRLFKRGLTKFDLRFCAVGFHLSHGKNNRLKYSDSLEKNNILLKEIVASGASQCEQGFRAHLRDKERYHHQDDKKTSSQNHQGTPYSEKP